MQNPSPFVASRPPLSCPFIFFQLSYFLTFSPKSKNSKTIFGPKDLKIEVFSSLNRSTRLITRKYLILILFSLNFCANIFAKLCCHLYDVKYVIFIFYVQMLAHVYIYLFHFSFLFSFFLF
jgi:hypothetical protein